MRKLIDAAEALRSEEGENPEYDRALVELINMVTGTCRLELAIHLRQRTREGS